MKKMIAMVLISCFLLSALPVMAFQPESAGANQLASISSPHDSLAGLDVAVLSDNELNLVQGAWWWSWATVVSWIAHQVVSQAVQSAVEGLWASRWGGGGKAW